MAEAEQDEDREAWVRLGNGEMSVRLRHLQDILRRGAVLTDVRLLESVDEEWTIWMRLSDRPGEFRLNRVRVDEPRTYRDVGLAINAVRQDFAYLGPIVLSTERRFPPRT